MWLTARVSLTAWFDKKHSTKKVKKRPMPRNAAQVPRSRAALIATSAENGPKGPFFGQICSLFSSRMAAEGLTWVNMGQTGVTWVQVAQNGINMGQNGSKSA